MSVQDNTRPNIPYLMARGIMSVLGGLVGFFVAVVLLRRDVLIGPNNLLYLTVLGALVGYLFSEPVARRSARMWARLSQEFGGVQPQVVLAAGTGATVALLITVLLNNVLAAVPGFTWFWSLLIASVLVVSSSWFFVVNRNLFTLVGTRQDAAPMVNQVLKRPRVVDTSAIIDGRIVDVIESHFVDGTMLVPRMVLGELQNIADSDDPLRRKRGRRGLEVLDRLVANQGISTEVINDDGGDAGEVDERLVQICLSRRADLVTTDYNLSRVAALQGIKVLNVNQLANALKAMYLPGEKLSLSIVRVGREADQGLAYLEDGTMVVVEDAAELVGRTIETVVTSNLQTNMGRMIFARPDPASSQQN